MNKRQADLPTAWEEVLDNERFASHKSIFGYALSALRQAKFYTAWKAFLTRFRQIRMVAITIKILSIVFGFLQTGAFVLLSTVLLLIVLPLLAAFMLGVLLTALLQSGKSNRFLRERLDQKTVYVLFLFKEDHPFSWQNARSLAADPSHAVILVSPYWISGKGPQHRYFYCTLREEAERIYLVRRYYFFKLKKQVLKDDVAYLF